MMAKKPLTVYTETTARARELCKFSKEPGNASVSQDMIRSAVVLAVAGFDAYFTDKFSDILVPYLKSRRPGPSLIKLLREAGLDTEAALEMAVMARPFRRIRTLVQRHVSAQTTQRFQAIDELFVSVGIKNLCANAEKKTGYKQLNARVEAFILKRHQIAHRADLNMRGEPNKILVEKIERRIEDLERLVVACDEIISKATAPKKPVSKKAT